MKKYENKKKKINITLIYLTFTNVNLHVIFLSKLVIFNSPYWSTDR